MTFKSTGPLKMSLEKASKILHEEVIPELGAQGQPPNNPTFVCIAGTPGSGKSTTIYNAKLGLQGATQIYDGDILDGYVDGYRHLALRDPIKAVRYAREAGSGFFGDGLLRRAVEMGVNICMESATPERCISNLKYYASQGYRTELHFVATPYHESLTAIPARAEKALVEDGHIGTNVLVPYGVHEKAYAEWARAVFEVESQGLADRIVITRRDGIVMYDNKLVSRGNASIEWEQKPYALEHVLLERHRAISDADATRLKGTWNRLVDSEHLNGIPDLATKIFLPACKDEVFDYVNDEASRFDLSTKPRVFSPEAIVRWQQNIADDLALCRRSRVTFGFSKEFDDLTHKYLAAVSTIAAERNGLLFVNQPTTLVAGENGPTTKRGLKRSNEETADHAPPEAKRVNTTRSTLGKRPRGVSNSI